MHKRFTPENTVRETECNTEPVGLTMEKNMKMAVTCSFGVMLQKVLEVPMGEKLGIASNTPKGGKRVGYQ